MGGKEIFWILLLGLAHSRKFLPLASNVSDSNREIPKGLYLSSNDVFAEKSSVLRETINSSFEGNELTEEELMRYTVDEKCDGGIPMAAAWQYYGPYAKPTKMHPGQTGVEGIFAHLINKMLHVCCNSSTTVKYGKVVDSIRTLERQLDDPNTAYDLSFPITSTSVEDVTFKDVPYIPFVQAPRVALLVRDTSELNKTSQLLRTVLKAWPILIFIIVAATLSGIIIWLLVSSSVCFISSI